MDVFESRGFPELTRILVIEDVASQAEAHYQAIRHYWPAALRDPDARFDRNPVFAATLELGLQRILSFRPHVVLLDWDLAVGPSGLDLPKRLDVLADEMRDPWFEEFPVIIHCSVHTRDAASLQVMLEEEKESRRPRLAWTLQKTQTFVPGLADWFELENALIRVRAATQRIRSFSFVTDQGQEEICLDDVAEIVSPRGGGRQSVGLRIFRAGAFETLWSRRSAFSSVQDLGSTLEAFEAPWRGNFVPAHRSQRWINLEMIDMILDGGNSARVRLKNGVWLPDPLNEAEFARLQEPLRTAKAAGFRIEVKSSAAISGRGATGT